MLFISFQVPTITQWLMNEFGNESEARIGADATLIPATVWDFWQSEMCKSAHNISKITFQ